MCLANTFNNGSKYMGILKQIHIFDALEKAMHSNF